MLTIPLQKVLQELNIELLPCRRILIVDDEVENLEVLSALLEDEWEVHQAHSGAQALELLPSLEPLDLIIADQRMPEMTGIDLLVHVAKQSPDTVRVVLTAYSDVNPMIEAVNRGHVYRFLLKPYDPLEMRTVVADALQFKYHTIALRRVVEDLAIRTAMLRKLQKDLQNTQEQLFIAERLSTLGRVAAGVTHEIRNQLTIISLILQSIEQKTREPQILKLAQEVWSGFNSFLKLLNHVHSFARTKAIKIDPKPQSVAEFCHKTLSLFHLEELGRHRNVKVQLDPGLDRLIMDQEGVSQVILAFLRNAALADSQQNPIILQVERGPNDDCYFAVIDRGCGMDDALRLRAMEPFYSGFKAWPGLGLGLEIARLVASAHGGRLELESTLGQGTTARLWLPIHGPKIEQEH